MKIYHIYVAGIFFQFNININIEKALKIGGQAGQRFLPIWLQSSVRSIKEQLEAGNVPSDIAADVALDFVYILVLCILDDLIDLTQKNIYNQYK